MKPLVEEILNLVGQGAVSRLSGLLENRKPILYSERDARTGGQFGRKLKSAAVDVLVTVPKIYRGAFLWGCANALKGLDHEQMLLGFGRREATRNSITAIMKIRGEQHSVRPTPTAIAMITAHLAADTRNSIMLVHNHPEHFLSSSLSLLLGPEPIPSLTDRDTALSALIQRLQKLANGNHHGEIRFFLVQNDDIAEFSGLNAGSLVDALRQFGPLLLRSAVSDPTRVR